MRWGPRDVIGNLIATGSDNDKNIYAKFRFPCHPVVHRASVGLSQLTGAAKADTLAALTLRGTTYRAMRDELIPLVTTPTERARGSLREKRAWDVADVASRTMARATGIHLEADCSGAPSAAVVPLHERLAHCCERGENAISVSHANHTQTTCAPPSTSAALAVPGRAERLTSRRSMSAGRAPPL